MVAPGSTRESDAPSCEAANTANIAVRCCADVDPTVSVPLPDPVPVPTSSPVVPVPAPTESPVPAPIPAPTMAPIDPVPAPTKAPNVPVPAPTKAPTNVLTSASTCDELGWNNADERGSTSVCGETDLGLGGCSGTKSHSEATAICEAAGARLCTVAELQADETRGTGCKYDTRMMWTSDECTGGYSIAPGSTRLATASSCETASTGDVYTRCCADV